MTREEAIELLVNATYSDEWQGNEQLTEANLMAIEALSADVVEVVRCKDCKHYVSDGGAIMYCEHTDIPTDTSDYCSYGERIEE